MWSGKIPPTGSRCILELALYQVEMSNGIIKLLIITNNTSWIAAERQGNNRTEYVNFSTINCLIVVIIIIIKSTFR